MNSVVESCATAYCTTYSVRCAQLYRVYVVHTQPHTQPLTHTHTYTPMCGGHSHIYYSNVNSLYRYAACSSTARKLHIVTTPHTMQ